MTKPSTDPTPTTQTATDDKELNDLRREKERLEVDLRMAKGSAERWEQRFQAEYQNYQEYREEERAAVIKFVVTLVTVVGTFSGAALYATRNETSGVEERRLAEREAVNYAKATTGSTSARAICYRQSACNGELLLCKAYVEPTAPPIQLCCDGDRPGDNIGCRPLSGN